MFIAANYVMNYYPQHNISPVIPTKPLITDTLQISDRVHFKQISAVLDIPVDELRVLNPQFRADIVPGSPERSYTLVLPSQQVHAYLMSEDAIKAHDATKYARRENVQPGEHPMIADNSVPETVADTNPEDSNLPVAAASASKGVRTVTHKVKPGESLASIAKTYNVAPEQIKSWNSLRRNAVRTGQLLRINTASGEGETELLTAEATEVPAGGERTWQSDAPASSSRKSVQAAAAKSKTKAKAPAAKVHKIKNGESLSSISKKYGVSIAELKRANGMTNDKLRAGKTLKIPAKSKTGSKKSTKKRSRR